MLNDSPDGLWGKHECGMAAVAIVKECEKRGMWNVCFSVPPRGGYHQRGFIWLIHFQELRPVPCLSDYWVVTQHFLDYMRGRHELPDTLDDDHGLYIPGGVGTNSLGLQNWKPMHAQMPETRV